MEMSLPLPVSSPLRTIHRFLPLSALESMFITLSAVVVALLIFGLFVAIMGYNAIDVYGTMWKGSFSNWYNIQRGMTLAAPLLLTGLCVALPLRLGMVIVGGEGAFLLGALA